MKTATTQEKKTIIVLLVRCHDYQFAQNTVHSGKAAGKLLLSFPGILCFVFLLYHGFVDLEIVTTVVSHVNKL